tara:strand:- start:888 stop:1673 length:786 start_codon:yes stop_codon:yes gene_type:complete
MIVDEYKEDKPNKHWSDIAQPLHAYKYSNVYDEQFYKTLKDTVISHLDRPDKLTYLTHRTSFTRNDKRLHIVSQPTLNNKDPRKQEVVYDLTAERDWWHQTSDSVVDWTWNRLQNSIHPVFFHHLNTFRHQKPHDNDWVPFRFHFNYLTYQSYLHAHADMADQFFNTPTARSARARSLTFYLHDHVEDQGGELYFLSGYVYKPKQNEAISINGNAAFHGVNSNMSPDKKPRLAFTVRWAHKDDLYLPGSPDKAMYKVDFPE